MLANADPSLSGINCKDEEGWAPIHSSSSSGHAGVVEVLIEKGQFFFIENHHCENSITAQLHSTVQCYKLGLPKLNFFRSFHFFLLHFLHHNCKR